MKGITLVAALIILCQAAWAQDGPKPNKKKENRIEMLDQKLELTEAQRSEIENLFASEKEQMKLLKEEIRTNRDSMRAIHDETHAQIKAILTPEQAAKFEEMKAERPDRGPRIDARKQHIKAMGAARSEFDAKLTTEEKTRIQEARKIRKEIMAVRKSDAPADKEQMKGFRIQIDSLLNPVYQAHKEEIEEIVDELEVEHARPERPNAPQDRKADAPKRKYYRFLMDE